MDDEVLGALEIFGGFVAAALTGGAGGAVGGSIPIADGASRMFYANLQKGKQDIHDRGVQNGWSDTQKREANKRYKAEFPELHRPGSPDVFPEV